MATTDAVALVNSHDPSICTSTTNIHVWLGDVVCGNSLIDAGSVIDCSVISAPLVAKALRRRTLR